MGRQSIEVKRLLVVLPEIGQGPIGKLGAPPVLPYGEGFVVAGKQVNCEELSYLGLIPQVSGGIRDRGITKPFHDPFFFGPHRTDNSEADRGLSIDKFLKLWVKVSEVASEERAQIVPGNGDQDELVLASTDPGGDRG